MMDQLFDKNTMTVLERLSILTILAKRCTELDSSADFDNIVYFQAISTCYDDIACLNDFFGD